MKVKARVQDDSPVQKARQRAAALALRDGTQHIDLCCGHCQSESIHSDPQEPSSFLCVSCGRKTPIGDAHRARRRAMKAFIERGIDIDIDFRARA